MILIRRVGGRAAVAPGSYEVELARDLPLTPYEFRGDTGELRDIGDHGWLWSAWSEPSGRRVEVRVRIAPDATWSVWAGYPGQRETWQLLVTGRAESRPRAVTWANAVLRGDLLLAGGVFPGAPALVKPSEPFAVREVRRAAEAKKARRQAERERRQDIADTREGFYPELLTEWPMSVAGNTGRPWRTVSFDGAIEHRVEESPAWGRNHHLRYFVDGEPVAGLRLKAKRPWRGQSAVIDVVYTDPAHRRQGYAAALLEEARSYFRQVRHSKELTGAGVAWKRGVRNWNGEGHRAKQPTYWHGTTAAEANKIRRNPVANNLFVAEDRERAEEYAFRAARQAGEPALLKLRVRNVTPDAWAAQEATSPGLAGHLGQWVADGPVEVIRAYVWSWSTEAWGRIE